MSESEKLSPASARRFRTNSALFSKPKIVIKILIFGYLGYYRRHWAHFASAGPLLLARGTSLAFLDSDATF